MLDMAKEGPLNKDDVEHRFHSLDTNRLFEVCKEHELEGVAGSCAISLGINLPTYWQEAYQKTYLRQNFLKEKAKEICSLMDEQGIKMVILKNGGIMLSIIENPAKCPMEDIDTLIKKDDFYKAHNILIDNGFVFKFRSEYEKDLLDEAFRHGSAEYYFVMPNGEKMWLELSWRTIDGRWIRPDLEPNTDLFIENSFVPKGTKAHVLCSEDNLLQVCIHTAKHSYCRAPGLRLHLDVDRIVTHCSIDWDLFLKKVNDCHVRTSVYFSLYIPTVLFETKVPSYVLESLKPKNSSRIERMLSKASLIHPHNNKKFSKIGFLRFQTALYDKKSDIVRVIYPSKEWINQRYGCKHFLKRSYCVFIRLLDLIGIRKRK